MKKRNILMALLACAMVLGLGVKSALAYFTTYVTASGGMVIHLGHRTVIEDDVSDWEKHVVISMTKGPDDVYIRARAYCPQGMELIYSGDGWSYGGDDWWYYEDKLVYEEDSAGNPTGTAVARELLVRMENIPADMKEGESFNVVVVYEATSVVDENGVPDFTKKVIEEGE